MREFPHCVLLTRVGGFYEMYFETAEEYGPLLGLKVAQKRVSAGSVSMTGFPFTALDRYLKALVQDHGNYVARITKVVTPGTLMDENFMDPSESHYLVAVTAGPGAGSDRVVWLAWLDLSTGNFFTQETTVGDMRADVARIGPKEVVLLGARYSGARESGLEEILRRERKTTTEEMKDIGVQAGNVLLDYTQTRLPGMAMRLQPPVRKTMTDSMIIGGATMRGLEIMQTSRNGSRKGALLSIIKKTTTQSGSRLLSNRIGKLDTNCTTKEHDYSAAVFTQ
ncbi:DNA mismatch repair protein MutS, connector domain-containing protein [Tuber indicum]|nr:DNA mismatch repair protein MutS, connector domain-containing protein [Tuber indicum]